MKKQTVFDRIKIDELYRDQKLRFLNKIEKMDQNNGKGNVSIDSSDKNINSFDFENFIKQGGKIKHLINPKMFETVYHKIQNQMLKYPNITHHKNIAHM